MRDKQDRLLLYDIWRRASRKGYSLRLEGVYIRLVPLTTRGDNGVDGVGRTFAWSRDGITRARAWLEAPDTLTHDA